jgi:hypothetical protein
MSPRLQSERPRSGNSIDRSIDDGTGERLDNVRDCLVAVTIGGAVVADGLGSEAVVGVEGGLVLGEATGGGVPDSDILVNRGSVAEDGDDGVGLFASGHAGAGVKVVGDLFVEVADVRFDVAAPGKDGPGFGAGPVEVGECVLGGGEVPLSVGAPVREVGEVMAGGGDLGLVAAPA